MQNHKATSDIKEIIGGAVMETLWQDLRYGIRMLQKSPGFTAMAVIALALGIGANTAIFSVVNAVLLRPLPFKDPGRLMTVWDEYPKDEFSPEPGEVVVSTPNFEDYRSRNQTFEQMAALEGGSFTLTGLDKPEQILGLRVSANFFSLLGSKPALGRDFLPGEDQLSGNRVVILSHRLWQRRFGADRSAIGQTLTLNGEIFTVVGVMPPNFRLSPGELELWTPLILDPNRSKRDFHHLFALARLKPGVVLKQAQADMTEIARGLALEYPKTNKGWGVRIVPLHEFFARNVRRALLMLLAAIGCVLLIACANVANLLLTLSISRQKEIAIRSALGADRLCLIRQLLTESGILSLLGGALGLLLALWGVRLLEALDPQILPRLDEINIDGRVLGFTSLVSLLTGMLFGLAPAFHASKIDLNKSLKVSGRGATAGRQRRQLRNLLVVLQISLAQVLLIGAGLMIRSFLRLQGTNPGFRPEKLLTIALTLPELKYREPRKMTTFYQQVLERITNLPGVESASIGNNIPIFGYSITVPVEIEGKPQPRAERQSVSYLSISPHYFRTLGIPLLKGRYFTEQDREGAPEVTIISESLARALWPGEDPVGKRLIMGLPEKNGYGPDMVREIVGVVGDCRHLGSDDKKPLREIYVPYLQQPLPWTRVVVRTTTQPMGLASASERQIHAVDKDLPTTAINSVEELLSMAFSRSRFSTFLLGIFAAVALILAMIGILGIMAYNVTQRTHEIGIRMALGAESRDLVKLVVSQGMVLAFLGVAIGLAGAFAFTRLLSSLLFELSPTDPITFGGVSLLLAAVALLACYLPARRATKVDPMAALRYE